MSAEPAALAPPLPAGRAEARRGAALVLAAAVVWSLGGLIGRALGGLDPWTVVAWRGGFAAAFLLLFMLLRDGRAGTARLFSAMGAPGLAVALAFATASTAFVVALQHTTVANILLVQAGVPLIAALMGWALFAERVAGLTWAAIAAVLLGVAVMVSDALAGRVSAPGTALALLIALAFATATVITRRFAGVRMTPAVCLGCALACGFAAARAPTLTVAAGDLPLLFAFGALNLGLGLALFVTGTRLVPAAVAALLGTAETVLGPVWVALVLGEIPTPRTVIGGTIVFLALLAHLLWQLRRAPHASG